MTGTAAQPGADQRHDGDAVDIRKHHIQQDHPRRRRQLLDRLARRQTIREQLHTIPLSLEHEVQELADVFVILDDQDGCLFDSHMLVSNPM